VLLDLEMPNMDGLEMLREIRSRGYRVPVIMVSALTLRGARVTIEALAPGASDYVAKPSGQMDSQSALQTLAKDLLPKIRALTAVKLVPPQPLCAIEPLAHVMKSAPAVVAIGASTGGPAALEIILGALPPDFPAPMLVVQHLPELFTAALAESLSQRCALPVHEAAEGMPVLPGNVYLARGNWHMEALSPVRAGAFPALHVHQGAMENHCRPAVDALFRSVAATYGPATLAVVLTGMGSDGLAGSRVIRSRGGTVLAQDQATSVVWGMPRAVAQAGLARRVLPLSDLPAQILRLFAKPGMNTVEAAGQAVPQ
jgi:two-component system chemotaxis response regulator CheB